MTENDPSGPAGLHPELREMLGSYVLDHLSPSDRGRVGAHLDGCAECRAELDEIADLATMLSRVDPKLFDSPPVPPSGLGDQIRARLSEETAVREAEDLDRRRRRRADRRTSWAQVGLVAAVLVLIAGVGGVVVGRSTAPEPPTPRAIPMEAISLTTAGGAAVSVEDAVLVNHTWGTELRFEASGFDRGATYSAAFRSDEGELTSAGEFLGTGSETMNCNLQSAILRDDLTSVIVTDEAGDVVLTSDL